MTRAAESSAQDLRTVFEAIYGEDRWTNGSGPGSRSDNTIEYRAFLERFMVENSVESVTDLGCGDWQFSKLIDWSAVRYTGLDVVPSLIEHNQRAFGRENIHFSVATPSLPGGDLLIAKECLQHLSNRHVMHLLGEIAARYKFALLTNAAAPHHMVNMDIQIGGWRPLRLEAQPFNAVGATVFTYYPRTDDHFWRNAVFLMIGAMTKAGPFADQK